MSSLVNFRDPAVLADPAGRLVRRGAFFRSAQPFPAADPRTVAELAEHDIRTVVDLRGGAEVREEDWAAAVAAGIEVLRVPMESSGGALDAVLWGMETSDDLGAFYLAVAESAPEAIRAAVDAAARPGGVLVHCAAGKDRTGLLIALLLDLLGVAGEEITADYARTTEALPQIWAGLADRHRAALNDLERSRVKLPAPLLAAPAEAMTAFLDLVHTRYGSAAGLLAHCGVPAETLAAVRAKAAADTAEVAAAAAE
ncbi:tyrosine-protein phosphatase [Kitasatospora viridis]|uniref:Protein tyrosine/serine phosphatase n=1 Tax=Kitasatospora viridis TaxID=281105 RepID=A0A561SDQ2_9ACTN|nr:tyrosine-protein phosphatase [Kitasatospora viridis]TWF72999.1 protein tyrosine/serine phosphatase [Kitasatospora viridis]